MFAGFLRCSSWLRLIRSFPDWASASDWGNLPRPGTWPWRCSGSPSQWPRRGARMTGCPPDANESSRFCPTGVQLGGGGGDVGVSLCFFFLEDPFAVDVLEGKQKETPVWGFCKKKNSCAFHSGVFVSLSTAGGPQTDTPLFSPQFPTAPHMQSVDRCSPLLLS